MLVGSLCRVHDAVFLSQSTEFTAQRTSPIVNQTFIEEHIHTGSSFAADATLTQLLKARKKLNRIGTENNMPTFVFVDHVSENLKLL